MDASGSPAFPSAPSGRTGWPWTEGVFPKEAAQTAHRPRLRITVVTPSFNQARFIEETIRSVLLQGYPNTEYIIMDGGSNDGSVEIVRKYAPWIAFWRSEKDAGQSDAIATGFEKAIGDIYCWLNSDDILLPGALDVVGEYFEKHPDAEAVNGAHFSIDETGAPTFRPHFNVSLGVAATYDRFRWYEMDGVFQQATFWRREAYMAAGGMDRDLQYIMDWDLFTRLAKRRRFGRIPRFLGCLRIHGAAKTALLDHVRIAETAKFRERYEVAARHPWIRRAKYWRFRLPSLARKAWLAVLVKTGSLPLGRGS